ncbi:peptidase family S64 domain-containing protein [Histoplasma capsulatum]|uniref:Peptidase family S64 domain-containing protein n=1 Tax=Ajellomyces capsulatus TaxID=5037 RepID=A0A8A1M3Q4_AJECA|nr:peptidase family S64 domain-containing protein [Histoplasma capsulatum]
MGAAGGRATPPHRPDQPHHVDLRGKGLEEIKGLQKTPMILSPYESKVFALAFPHSFSKPSGPKPLVVVLTVSKASTQDWVSIREELVQILDIYHLKYIGVEILRGEKVFGTANNYDRMLLTDDAFTKGMSVGRSIGPRGSQNHASTFGGFIRLQNLKGNWHTFGLTCFHSVAPDGCGQLALKTWQREGITVGDKTNDLEIDSPSLGDAEETAREWRNSIDARRDNDARLGKVYAASGYRQSNSRAVDWALIEVDESRITSNKFPKAGGDLPPKYVISFLAMGENVPGVASIDPDMEVFKNWTLDWVYCWKTCGGLIAQPCILGYRTKWGLGRKKLNQRLILSLPTKSSILSLEHGRLWFICAGFAWNFAGLYFGGTTDLRGVGFFTSADDLITDIKRVTEAKDVRFDV